MLNDCGRIGRLSIFIFLLGCYQQKPDDGYESGDGGCSVREHVAMLDPTRSTIVVKFENGQEDVDPDGKIGVLGGDCAGTSCRLELDLMEVKLPTTTWKNYTLSNAVLTLDETVRGIVDEHQDINITNTYFYLNFNATVDGFPISTRLTTSSNVSGGYNAQTGELVLTGTLIEAEDSLMPVELPWVEIPFLFTAYQNCTN